MSASLKGVAAGNARKTHCPQGHPYDEANTHVDRRGRRRCRACELARVQARRRAAGTLGRPSGPEVNRAKTHCLRGHPFDEANTYVTGDGRRLCRACNRLRAAASAKRRADELRELRAEVRRLRAGAAR